MGGGAEEMFDLNFEKVACFHRHILEMSWSRFAKFDSNLEASEAKFHVKCPGATGEYILLMKEIRHQLRGSLSNYL